MAVLSAFQDVLDGIIHVTTFSDTGYKMSDAVLTFDDFGSWLAINSKRREILNHGLTFFAGGLRIHTSLGFQISHSRGKFTVVFIGLQPGDPDEIYSDFFSSSLALKILSKYEPEIKNWIEDPYVSLAVR